MCHVNFDLCMCSHAAIPSSTDYGLSGGVIAAIIIAVVLAVLIIVAILVICWILGLRFPDWMSQIYLFSKLAVFGDVISMIVKICAVEIAGSGMSISVFVRCFVKRLASIHGR